MSPYLIGPSSYIRIEEFTTVPDKTMELHSALETSAEKLKSSEGCKAAWVMRNTAIEGEAILIEVWSSLQARQATGLLTSRSSEITIDSVLVPSKVRTFVQ